MVALAELNDYLRALLEPERFADYCPNGLQVEGRAEVGRIVTGVTASRALLERAVEVSADAILVHHGYFWRGEAEPIVGIKRNRLRLLLMHEISLLAYHLPLDAHPVWGNNVRLANKLGLEWERSFDQGIGGIARLPVAEQAEAWVSRLAAQLGRVPLHIQGSSDQIGRIGLCTGAGQSCFEKAIRCGVDVFLTGEISEAMVHWARESGIHLIAAGHHATERYGVQALGNHLAEHFGIDSIWVDIDSPV